MRLHCCYPGVHGAPQPVASLVVVTSCVDTLHVNVPCCAQSDKLNQYYGSSRGKWLGALGLESPSQAEITACVCRPPSVI